MKTVGLYPGSFNPWHKGHEDILNKALSVFETVIVAVGTNPAKSDFGGWATLPDFLTSPKFPYGVEATRFRGLLSDFVSKYNQTNQDKITAVIRGLRSGYDLQYEQNMQYWNEDLGLSVPTVYFIADRSLAHISSSAIRQIQQVGEAAK